jgi:hypothetical protein
MWRMGGNFAFLVMKVPYGCVSDLKYIYILLTIHLDLCFEVLLFPKDIPLYFCKGNENLLG